MTRALALIVALSTTQAVAEWRVSIDRDPMTDATKAYATSGWTEPVDRISGIYSNLRATMGVGCDGGNEWAYVKFNQQINSSDSLTRDGYNLIQAAVRWDQEKATSFQGPQTWGSSSFNLKDEHISEIMSHSNALVGLSWYSVGEVYVRFDLTGSADAIQRAREACSG